MLPENDEPSVLLALQRAAHRTVQALATALAELELTPSELNTLANLADGRARNVRELDAADRRSFLVTLTDQGRTIAAQVRHAVADLERSALADLSTRQLSGYHAVITALQEVS